MHTETSPARGFNRNAHALVRQATAKEAAARAADVADLLGMYASAPDHGAPPATIIEDLEDARDDLAAALVAFDALDGVTVA